MTSLNFFELAEQPPSDNEHHDDGGCGCPPGDDKYLLEIEEGQVVLVHAACGKQPSASWGDWQDLVSMAPIPVTVTWERECDGSMWHGMDRCDHGSYLVAEATSVPEDVRKDTLEQTRKHAA